MQVQTTETDWLRPEYCVVRTLMDQAEGPLQPVPPIVGIDFGYDEPAFDMRDWARSLLRDVMDRVEGPLQLVAPRPGAAAAARLARTFAPVGLFESLQLEGKREDPLLRLKMRRGPEYCMTAEQMTALRDQLNCALENAGCEAEALTKALVAGSVELGVHGVAMPTGTPRRGVPPTRRPRRREGVVQWPGNPLAPTNSERVIPEDETDRLVENMRRGFVVENGRARMETDDEFRRRLLRCRPALGTATGYEIDDAAAGYELARTARLAGIPSRRRGETDAELRARAQRIDALSRDLGVQTVPIRWDGEQLVVTQRNGPAGRLDYARIGPNEYRLEATPVQLAAVEERERYAAEVTSRADLTGDLEWRLTVRCKNFKRLCDELDGPPTRWQWQAFESARRLLQALALRVMDGERTEPRNPRAGEIVPNAMYRPGRDYVYETMCGPIVERGR